MRTKRRIETDFEYLQFEKRSHPNMEERLYDLIFICRPATPEDEITKIITTIEHSATEHGGKIEKTEKWGTRRLAYRVSKHREGFFVYMSIRGAQGDIIK